MPCTFCLHYHSAQRILRMMVMYDAKMTARLVLNHKPTFWPSMRPKIVRSWSHLASKDFDFAKATSIQNQSSRAGATNRNNQAAISCQKARTRWRINEKRMEAEHWSLILVLTWLGGSTSKNSIIIVRNSYIIGIDQNSMAQSRLRGICQDSRAPFEPSYHLPKRSQIANILCIVQW